MRRMRRGAGGGHEFGGSGEDSFVAVVVTKLTGALLFILLLTMVIMALIPKAIDLPRPESVAEAADPEAADETPLELATPEDLPEAIAGRPYHLALATLGGRGPLNWSIEGPLPDGLTLDPETGLIDGVPKRGTPEPSTLHVVVRDGDRRAEGDVRLVVFESGRLLGLPSKIGPTLPAVPWRSWLDQGFGFLVLALVHLTGTNAVSGLERNRLEGIDDEDRARRTSTRFACYRWVVRFATLASCLALAVYLGWPRSS